MSERLRRKAEKERWDEPRPGPASLRDIQREVGKWHREQFGDIEAVACLLKTMSELGELADIDCASYENQAGLPMRLPGKTRHVEAPDVFISLLAYCDRVGINLESALRERWATVREREYGTSLRPVNVGALVARLLPVDKTPERDRTALNRTDRS